MFTHGGRLAGVDVAVVAKSVSYVRSIWLKMIDGIRTPRWYMVSTVILGIRLADDADEGSENTYDDDHVDVSLVLLTHFDGLCDVA